MQPIPRKKLYLALRGDEPLLALRSAVKAYVDSGHSRDAILADLEQFRAELRVLGNESDEDTVMEVMDFLVGFCSPHMRI